MRRFRKILPVILMIWPYLYFVTLILYDKVGEEAYTSISNVYLVLTLIVYILNIWNAFSYPHEEMGRKLAFYNMVTKLVHIPFYLCVFSLGVLLILAMVVPALLFFSPIVITILAVIDFFLMATSSMYGVSAAFRLSKNGVITKPTAVLYSVLHLVFVVDVISAVFLYRKAKKI